MQLAALGRFATLLLRGWVVYLLWFGILVVVEQGLAILSAGFVLLFKDRGEHDVVQVLKILKLEGVRLLSLIRGKAVLDGQFPLTALFKRISVVAD